MAKNLYQVYHMGARMMLVGRPVAGYREALEYRRFSLLKYRARYCNVALQAGGIVDTPSRSQCVMCACYCAHCLRRVKP